MTSRMMGLFLLLAGCEVSPVEARSMDWELESARPAAAAAPVGTAEATEAPVSTAGITASTIASAAVAADVNGCGAAGGRPCPLQAMMRGSAQVSVVRGDFGGMEKAFSRIAGLAPAGYDGWTEISARGARAAREEDLVAVKAACNACHGTFRDKYRASSLRSNPLP